MTALDLEGTLGVVELVDAYLDSKASPEYQAQPLAQHWARVTKVCEESGEVWEKWSRFTRENPRKDPGSLEEVLGELGDVVSAAMCAIQHLTKDKERTWEFVSAALLKAQSRTGACEY